MMEERAPHNIHCVGEISAALRPTQRFVPAEGFAMAKIEVIVLVVVQNIAVTPHTAAKVENVNTAIEWVIGGGAILNVTTKAQMCHIQNLWTGLILDQSRQIQKIMESKTSKPHQRNF